MNRIEFLARCLARQDMVDPDEQVSDVNYKAWENSRVRLKSDHCMSAWRFYVRDTVAALQALVNLEALKDLTDDQLRNIANGATGPGDSRTNSYGVPYDHPLLVALNKEIEEVFR